MDIKTISKIKWLSRWAGSYTFISCSYWGPEYYFSLKRILGISFNHVLFFHRRGTVSFFVADNEFRRFGVKLARQSVANTNYVKKMCVELKRNTDILLPLMSKLQLKIPSAEEFKNFLVYFDRHLAYHNFVKKTVDFIDPEKLPRLLPYFTDARIYSEAVYSSSEIFFRKIAALIAKEKGYPSQILTCLTKKEFDIFLNFRKLPSKNILSNRYQNSILYFAFGKETIYTGRNAKKIESLINKQSNLTKNQLEGVGAYPGVVRAIVRIILDPREKHVFNRGDILVTGMTRPEFLSYVKKASAI